MKGFKIKTMFCSVLFGFSFLRFVLFVFFFSSRFYAFFFVVFVFCLCVVIVFVGAFRFCCLLFSWKERRAGWHYRESIRVI